MSTRSMPAGSGSREDTPSPRGAGCDSRRCWAGLGVILVLAFVVYWPALKGDFVWDDRLLVMRNPLATGEMSLGSIWFRTDFPLSLILLWIQWLWFGVHPAGYHVVNVFLHAISAGLLWRVLLRLKIPGAWWAAILFTVHPVAAASVAWISELKNTLSLPFYLLSILWYLQFENENGQGHKGAARRFYGLSVLAFLFALFSKTSTVMLPVVLLGCAWWQRGRIGRLDIFRTAPFFLLALILGCLTIRFQAEVIATGDPVQTANFWGRFAEAGRAIWFYLGKGVWPLSLSMIYPRSQLNPAELASYVPALLWLGVLVLTWSFRGRIGRGPFFGAAVFTATLFPVLGFFSMDFLAISRVSDHLQYLPLTVTVALMGAAIYSSTLTSAQRIIPILLTIGWSLLTIGRAQVIATDEALWRDTLMRNPQAWTAHNNLGCVLAARNEIEPAMAHFEAALRLNPKNASAHGNLARALALRGRSAEAEDQFKIALSLKPADAQTQEAFASFLAREGRPQEAIEHLRLALRTSHDTGPALQLATLLYQTGQPREAVAQYRQVLARKPDTQEALNNLAWLLATSPDETVRSGADAIRFAEDACRLTSYTNATAVGTLAAAYAEARQFTNAVATATKAVNLAAAAGDRQFAEVNQQLLKLYQAGVPYRER